MKVLRIVGGIVAGYLVWSLGLSALVIRWFTGDQRPAGPLWTGILLLSLVLLGAAAAYATRLASGPMASVALRFLLAAVVVVTVANMLLGVATEPMWFKVTGLVLVSPPIVVLQRHVARQGRDGATVP